jgi:hypothetical protein
MIIWGSTGREIVLDRGQFFCPQCQAKRSYKHLRLARYFTLYFIPLFQTQNLGEYIKCEDCKQTFKKEVLSDGPAYEMIHLVSSILADLKSGTPIPMAQRKLVNAGVEEDTANKLVAAAVGDNRKACAKCNLTFFGTVARCSGCGGPLAQAEGAAADQRITAAPPPPRDLEI